MNANAQALKPAAELARARPGAIPQRERGISRRPHGAARRGDRIAPPYRARRGPAPRAAAGRPGDRRLSLRRRRRPDRFRRAASATSRPSQSTATCSGPSGRARARCAPTHLAPGRAMQPTSAKRSRLPSSRARRSSAWSPGKRSEAGGTFVCSATSTAPIRATISASCPNGSESPGPQRVHAPRRDHPPLLVGRDDGRRPRTRVRTRAARPTRPPYGWCWTARPKVGARIGIRSSSTLRGPAQTQTHRRVDDARDGDRQGHQRLGGRRHADA